MPQVCMKRGAVDLAIKVAKDGLRCSGIVGGDHAVAARQAARIVHMVHDCAVPGLQVHAAVQREAPAAACQQ